MAFMAAALPVISAVSAVAGVGMGALSAIQQSNAMRAQAGFASAQARAQADAVNADARTRASLYAYNARMAEINAQEQADAIDNQAYQARIRAKKILGAQTAAYGKAGVQMEGTPLDIQEESAAQAEFDQLAFGHEKKMALWRGGEEAKMHRWSADATLSGADRTAQGILAGGKYKADVLRTAAGTTLLTGLGKTAMWGLDRYSDKIAASFQPSSRITVDPTDWGQYAMLED